MYSNNKVILLKDLKLMLEISVYTHVFCVTRTNLVPVTVTATWSDAVALLLTGKRFREVERNEFAYSENDL